MHHPDRFLVYQRIALRNAAINKLARITPGFNNIYRNDTYSVGGDLFDNLESILYHWRQLNRNTTRGAFLLRRPFGRSLGPDLANTSVGKWVGTAYTVYILNPFPALETGFYTIGGEIIC